MEKSIQIHKHVSRRGFSLVTNIYSHAYYILETRHSLYFYMFEKWEALSYNLIQNLFSPSWISTLTVWEQFSFFFQWRRYKLFIDIIIFLSRRKVVIDVSSGFLFIFYTKQNI